ncbi:hypothetical protein BC829DRAFT_447343 [Chytridium lagenaria]|nr:hypothetical protein BC829DRAFT_447343 [Chytridium lagenaria]
MRKKGATSGMLRDPVAQVQADVEDGDGEDNNDWNGQAIGGSGVMDRAVGVEDQKKKTAQIKEDAVSRSQSSTANVDIEMVTI